MLAKGKDIALIGEATGLTEAQIEQLKLNSLAAASGQDRSSRTSK